MALATESSGGQYGISVACRAQVGFARPYGIQQTVILIQLMIPGAVRVIQHSSVKILHKLCIVHSVVHFSGHMP